MKIRIYKEEESYLVSIEKSIGLDGMDCCVINDEAHSNLGEVEAKARADALRAVTGWEVVKEYEL